MSMDAMSKALKGRRNRTVEGKQGASYSAKEKATWADHDKAMGKQLRIRPLPGNPGKHSY